MASTSMLIAVAPNGARKTKRDHSKLPLSTDELIETAISCLDAGAAMMHFHVRDSFGRHTLDHNIYGPVLKELEAVVGENMLLQVSSESAGIYRPDEQIEQMKRLAPHCLSCGLREVFGDGKDYSAGHEFITELHRTGVLLQYILYSPADVVWYETLCADGVIPGKNHLLLFVLGRYDQGTGSDCQLDNYVASLKRKRPWMVCGFGQLEHDLVAQAAERGGHVRVGFENNLSLADGSLAPDNATLVRLSADQARSAGRLPGDKLFAESLHRCET